MNDLANRDSTCRLGVLAFGDSITNAGGELQWGVAMHSWALWLARGLGVPFSNFAVDGALVEDVVRKQIPAFCLQMRNPEARFDVGCLYVGANNICGGGWDPVSFEPEFAQAARFVRERCDRVLMAAAPLDFGRPRLGTRVVELNEVVGRCAADVAALIIDLRDLRARNLVMTDHLHPTAFGQIAIAERALAVLERDGAQVSVRPSSLVSYETTRWRRLRGDLRYLHRHARVTTWAVGATVRAARARRPVRS